MGQMMAEQVSLSREEGGTKEGLSEEVTLELWSVCEKVAAV